MDWDDLRFVLSVARARSLAGAGLELRVAATTVGRRLDALEHALSTRLFDRTAAGFEPTQPGQLVLNRAREVELQCLAVEREVKGLDARPAGNVTVAALDLLLDDFVIPRLHLLRERFPELVVTAVSGLKLLDLGRQEADVAVRTTAPSHPDLIGQRLGETAVGVFHRRGFKWTGTAPLIGLPESFGDNPLHQALCAQFRKHRFVARTNTEAHMRSLARAGIGLAALDCFAADADPTLERAVPEPIARGDLWLVTHVDSHRSARVRAVTQFLAEQFAAMEQTFSGNAIAARPTASKPIERRKQRKAQRH